MTHPQIAPRSRSHNRRTAIATLCICICHLLRQPSCPLCVAWHLLNGETG